jgi:heme oxygenase (biliverdin-IX-beta and delta-forming)
MLRDLLKSETHVLHEALEANPRIRPILDRTISRPAYGALLERLVGYYRPLETALHRFQYPILDLGLQLHPRRKLPLLISDLAALGAARPESLPDARDLPHLDSADRAFGCLYVLEGATLGGRHLEHYLRDVLHLTPDSGAAFYHGYGDATQAMWTDFLRALERFDPGDPGEVVEGARQTFDTLDRWLKA